MHKIISKVQDVNNMISINYLSDFVNYLDVSSATIQTYSKSLRQMFKFFALNEIHNPTREDIVSFRRYLEQEGKKPSTIALYIASAKRFFAWTEQKGLYANIAQGVKAPRQSKSHKKDCLSSSQVKNMLNGIDRRSLEGKRNFALLALMATCGLRTIEVVRANIEDLRNEGEILCLYIQGKGRNAKDEFVKISEPVEVAIREYLEARGKCKDTEPLFASCSKRNYGQRLTTRTISGLCKVSMIKAGLKSSRLTAHSLRHTAITLALLSGVSLSEVSEFARHSSISVTTIYAHHVNRLKSKCELSVSNAIFS